MHGRVDLRQGGGTGRKRGRGNSCPDFMVRRPVQLVSAGRAEKHNSGNRFGRGRRSWAGQRRSGDGRLSHRGDGPFLWWSGMTLGAKQAGVEILYAVERCPVTAGTYRKNFPEIPMFVGDIRKLQTVPPRPKDRRTVVFGGPPCQGFFDFESTNKEPLESCQLDVRGVHPGRADVESRLDRDRKR